jgi:predicted N-acetyltransferase YhbS
MASVASVLIRKATAGDAEGVSDCLRSAFEPFRNAYTPEAFADSAPTSSVMARRLEEMCQFVAITEAGEIVGTVGYKLIDAEEAHLRGMAVPPAHQGSGIAQRLLEALESEVGLRRCRRISLDTTRPLSRAASFYEKNGFRPSGRVSDFFGMPLYEYTKDLTKAAPEGRTS